MNAHHELHWIWAGTHKDEDFPEFMTQRQPMEKSPDCEVKKELKVTTKLHLIEGRLDESVTYLLQWAQQKKDSVHLCCRNLHIQGLTKARVIDVFKTVHAGCIQTLILQSISMEVLAFLNPYLTQMKSLFTLSLDRIRSTFSMGDSERLEEEKIFRLSSQLPIFHCLQNLCIDHVSFIKGNLKECLRCLKKPLKTLSITNCDILQSDLDYLPYCLNIFELKCLQLLDMYLSDLFLEPLGFLLERVRDTLQSLELDSCHIEDFQFSALLPALSQCSHLTLVNFSENNVSLLFLKELLHHTAKLSQLTNEQYPAPLECYDDNGVTLTHRLENLAPELLDILRAKRELNTVSFETARCSKCDGFYVYDLESQCCYFVPML